MGIKEPTIDNVNTKAQKIGPNWQVPWKRAHVHIFWKLSSCNHL